MLPQAESPYIQHIDYPIAARYGVELSVLRLDVVHPTISGNKWYKLKYNLQKALDEGYERVLTFGGAYSNHLLAVGVAADQLRLRSIGVVRGEAMEPLNPTLKSAKDHGMELFFVTREMYRLKASKTFIADLETKFGKAYVIPIGGTNCLALKGVMEIPDEIDRKFDYVAAAMGTGGTVAGLTLGFEPDGTILGFSGLKGIDFNRVVSDLLKECGLTQKTSLHILNEFHFGGYAKFNNDLINFINEFKSQFAIPLDPIYTGKLMYGIMELLASGFFPKGASILAIHTGGLQGIEGFNRRFGPLIK